MSNLNGKIILKTKRKNQNTITVHNFRHVFYIKILKNKNTISLTKIKQVVELENCNKKIQNKLRIYKINNKSKDKKFPK